MIDAQAKHNAMTQEIAHKAYDALGRVNALVLAAGGCSLCDKCALQTSQPCRHPSDALSSLEAYGMHVSKTAVEIGMPYLNGKDTVTYFSGLFW